MKSFNLLDLYKIQYFFVPLFQLILDVTNKLRLNIHYFNILDMYSNHKHERGKKKKKGKITCDILSEKIGEFINLSSN